MKITSHILLASIVFMLTGCVNPNPPVQKADDTEKYQGREETKALQNADNIGYDGTGIQKKLDKALDQNDQRAADLNNQIDAQTSGEAKPDDQ
jgi:starvation-inducible outer membrane lipoprotein